MCVRQWNSVWWEWEVGTESDFRENAKEWAQFGSGSEPRAGMLSESRAFALILPAPLTFIRIFPLPADSLTFDFETWETWIEIRETLCSDSHRLSDSNFFSLNRIISGRDPAGTWRISCCNLWNIAFWNYSLGGSFFSTVSGQDPFHPLSP